MDRDNEGQPECRPKQFPGAPRGKDQKDAVGGQRPPLDGEVSPHEEPTPEAQAAVKRGR